MIREVDYATFSVDHRDHLRIVGFNKGFTALTGYTEQDIYTRKMTLHDIIPSRMWEEYSVSLRHASRSEDGAGYLEHPILRKDGSSIIVLCYGKRRDDGSDISDILITNITSHIEAQNTVVRQAKETHIIGRIINIEHEVQKNQVLEEQLQCDSLTSLYNQRASRSKIDEAALETTEKCTNAFIIMNLNHFKEVNDTYGHTQGDELLRDVSSTLRQFFQSGTDIVGRLGGDEFVIFMRDVPSASLVRKYCLELLDEIRKPHFYKQTTFHITASMGIALQDNGPDSFDHLYKCADEALFAQKNSGESGLCFYPAASPQPK